MKKFIFLSILLLTIGFSQDLLELGLEAYDKGDYTKSAELFEKGCNSGNVGGCANLGLLYDVGQGVKQDYKKAAELYEKACNSGNVISCFNLGIMYENGIGVEQSYLQIA